MELMLMTPTKDVENELKTINELFEYGLSTLHINKPSMSTKKMNDYIKGINTHFHSKIMLHSHHDLAFKYNLQGIHLTSYHLEKRFKLWCLFKKEKLYHKSFLHSKSYKKVSDAFQEEKIKFDYYLLGTVFNKITNEPNVGFHPLRVQEILKTGKKIIARGGINHNTIPKVKALNFHGAVLGSVIWKNERPIEAFTTIKQLSD